MNVKGTVFKYGDNVDTDVIIPARYLNTSDPRALAAHCMEDIDTEFVKKVQKLPASFTATPSTSVCRLSNRRKRPLTLNPATR